MKTLKQIITETRGRGTKGDKHITHKDYASWEADAKKLGYHITHHHDLNDPTRKWDLAHKTEREDPNQGYENHPHGPPSNRARGHFTHNIHYAGQGYGHLRYKYMPEGLHIHTLITHHQQFQTFGKHVGHQLHGHGIAFRRAMRLKKIRKERAARKVTSEAALNEEGTSRMHHRLYFNHKNMKKTAERKNNAAEAERHARRMEYHAAEYKRLTGDHPESIVYEAIINTAQDKAQRQAFHGLEKKIIKPKIGLNKSDFQKKLIKPVQSNIKNMIDQIANQGVGGAGLTPTQVATV